MDKCRMPVLSDDIGYDAVRNEKTGFRNAKEARLGRPDKESTVKHGLHPCPVGMSGQELLIYSPVGTESQHYPLNGHLSRRKSLAAGNRTGSIAAVSGSK